MGVRTGTEFIAGLRDSREVWLGNERVTDVTTHPAFRGAIESLARLYDMQHEPAYRELLTYPSPTTGDPVGLSFLIPRTRKDLTRRRQMIKTWADATCGMMGRSADFLNTMVTAWAAKRDYFAQQSPACAERVWRYYESCRERDLFLTHALIDPQVDRAKNRAEQDDPYLCLRIVEETKQGLIVRGAKMIATAAPFADEILLWPFPPTLTEAEAPYALVFIIPVAAPGLKIICRESFSRPGQDADHPLSARFDEMDAVAVFADVLVPWERVFLHSDVRLVEMVRRLGAGGLMQLPASSAAFASPIGRDLEKYYRGARISAQEKVALFKLAWDLVGSDFGSRHTLYELYYAGDPSLLMAGFHREFDKAACVARVKEFLTQPASPVC